MGGARGTLLLTFNKDFSELARRSALPRTCGVVLLRTSMPKPGDVERRLAHLMAGASDWAGHFSVVEPGRVRMRPLGQHAGSPALSDRSSVVDKRRSE